MADQTTIRGNLKRLIVESLNLEGLTPESIADDTPLFGQGLGLDSVDALELVVALEQEYGISAHRTLGQIITANTGLAEPADVFKLGTIVRSDAEAGASVPLVLSLTARDPAAIANETHSPLHVPLRC